MCRVGPALIRNHLAWLAFVIRVITLPPLVFVNMWYPRVTSDMYWVSRQNHPDYLAFKLIRDEADNGYEAWTRGELSEDDARNVVRVLSERLRQWDEQSQSRGFRLFTSDFQIVDRMECSPFHLDDGRVALLESQEKIEGYSLCDYLIFVF